MALPPFSSHHQKQNRINPNIPFASFNPISTPKILHLVPRETLVSYSSCHTPSKRAKGLFTVLALVDDESVVTEEINNEEQKNEKDDVLDGGLRKEARLCELYVCNLPRSCDIAELAEKFKPFGTVLSVEVWRNPETGESRGCGYVTMKSVNSAKKAIVGLDGSVECWTIKPEELRNQFSQFGTVVSARVLYDRKAGKNRAHGFLTFLSAADRDAALSLDGTVKEFCGRMLVVKKGVEKTEL